MVLGLVGFDRFLATSIEAAVTRQGHFCIVFDRPQSLESMIQDEVELPRFDTLIFEGTQNPRVVRFSLGRLTELRGQLYKEVCVVALYEDVEFWEPIEDDVDQWLEGLNHWRCEVIHLFDRD